MQIYHEYSIYQLAVIYTEVFISNIKNEISFLHDGVKSKQWMMVSILDHGNADRMKTSDNTENNTFTETDTLMTLRWNEA